MPLLSELKQSAANQHQAKISLRQRAPGYVAAASVGNVRQDGAKQRWQGQQTCQRMLAPPSSPSSGAAAEHVKAHVGEIEATVDKVVEVATPQSDIVTRQARIGEIVEAKVAEALGRAIVKLEACVWDCFAKRIRPFEEQLEAIVQESAASWQQMGTKFIQLEAGLTNRVAELEQALEEASCVAAQARETETAVGLQQALHLDELRALVHNEIGERESLASELQKAVAEVSVFVETQSEDVAAVECEEAASCQLERADDASAMTMEQLAASVQELAIEFQTDREAREKAYSDLAIDVGGAWRAVHHFYDDLASMRRAKKEQVDLVDIDRLSKLIESERRERLEFTTSVGQEFAAFLQATQAESELRAGEVAQMKSELRSLVDFHGSASTRGGVCNRARASQSCWQGVTAGLLR